jgi:hypothetical protein
VTAYKRKISVHAEVPLSGESTLIFANTLRRDAMHISGGRVRGEKWSARLLSRTARSPQELCAECAAPEVRYRP